MAIDPAAETARYIDGLGSEALAKAAAYTTGSHWILLWGLVVAAVITLLVVRWGVLDKLSARLGGRSFFIRCWAVCTTFLILSSLLSLPWGIYTDWWREAQYGRSSQPFSDYATQGAISLLLSAVLGGLFLTGLYAFIRRAGSRWWLWSGLFAAGTVSLVILLSPILIEPIFNDYKPVPPGPVRTALIEMAAEAGIPPDRIFVYDGSRQSNNFTANVSGVFGSARIAISDIALGQASLDEVMAVTGHEIGHYVLGHVWLRIAVISVLAMLFFFAADRIFPRFARLFGFGGDLRDPAGVPVFTFIVSLLGIVATPVNNAVIRMGEREADAYSLRTVNLPDALATALVKTAEYRYPRPQAWQEILFYTHPSVEKRVRAAMEWKAANPQPSR